MPASLASFRRPARAARLERQRAGGFTLIEILVVVAILVILIGLLVTFGAGAKQSAQIRQTRLTLKTADGLMKDYLDGGNAEPDNPNATGYVANPDMNSTNPVSDATRWVKLLKAYPPTASKLNSLTAGTVTDPDDGTAKATVILDAFGTPIRYVPGVSGLANVKKEGYFQSAGPDRNFETATPAPATKLAPDDLYSTDP